MMLFLDSSLLSPLVRRPNSRRVCPDTDRLHGDERHVMAPKSDYVQRLLQAEERRNKLIADARANKASQAKKAKADAEKAVADFKAEKEREIASFKATLDTAAAAEQRELINQADAEIESMKKLSAQRMKAVTNLIASLATTVVP